jgi:hypothetical protein
MKDQADNARNTRGGGRQRLVVQLGKGWRQFTLPVPGLAMLGTVLRGLEIGALARTADGRYLQVNGSIVREWPAQRVEPAIARARHWLAAHSRLAPPPEPEASEHSPAVDLAARTLAVVTYKRRRIVDVAALDQPHAHPASDPT